MDAASTRAAKLFGLFPRKGRSPLAAMPTWSSSIPITEARFRLATQHVNNDYNGFEGMEIDGRPSVVTVRGKVQVRDGQFVGEKGRGRFLRREPLILT